MFHLPGCANEQRCEVLVSLTREVKDCLHAFTFKPKQAAHSTTWSGDQNLCCKLKRKVSCLEAEGQGSAPGLLEIGDEPGFEICLPCVPALVLPL